MLTDHAYDIMADYIVGIYSQIEMELLLDVANRFSTYSSIDGSIEWYLKKLKEMNALDKNAVEIFAKYSRKTKEYIIEMLKKAQFGNLDEQEVTKAFESGLTELTYDDLIKNKLFKETFEKSYKEINKTFRLIQTKAIESQKQAYMDILNKAYIDVSSGTYSYSTAIQNGIQSMAKNGIYAATYKRNGKIVHYGIESIVRRDTLTAAHRLSNEVTFESIEVMGTNYIDISSHLGARVNDTNPIANHAGWQGKQYQLKGSSKEYPNFAEATGYGNILGFGGVNCRHRGFPFFPGISVPYAVQYPEEKNRKVYLASQKQRSMERSMRSLKKQRNCLKAIDDKDGVRQLTKEINAQSDKLNDFCEENNLKRDYSREWVYQ